MIKKKSRRERLRKRNIVRNRIIIAMAIVLIMGISSAIIFTNKNDSGDKKEVIIEDNDIKENNEKFSDTNNIEKVEVNNDTITITAAGDCTLGTDTNFGYYGSFQAAVEAYNYDYSTFMRNVVDVFNNDDYTIVNLETTFTDSTIKADKGTGRVFHFKGPKEYVNILTSSSIEGVTLANNHTYDYGEVGINDTMNVLKENNVDFCGNGFKIIKDIRGTKIGFLGYGAWWISKEFNENLKNDIEELRNEGCSIVIPYFHWGDEGQYIPSETQKSIGRYAIDNGADMVLGSHPHVMQSMENYNGKLIVYSLGNFCFGGNSNPTDKQTLMIQTKFEMEDNNIKGIKYKVIPTIVSSVNYKNDYIPTIASNDEESLIIDKINELSPTLNNSISLDFFELN